MPRTVTFTFDAGSHRELKGVKLTGSFEKATGRFDPAWEGGAAVPMRPLGDGRWQVALTIADDDGQAHDWRWGVVADGPAGDGQWAVMGEGPLPVPPGPAAHHALTSYDRMGPRPRPDGGFSLRFWAPFARAVAVKLVDARGRTRRLPMLRAADGTFGCGLAPGLVRGRAFSYRYLVTTSTGQVVQRPDPYARQMQGEQRGLSRAFLDVRTGEEVSQYFVQPDLARRLAERHGSFGAAPPAERAEALEASRAEFMRFEIDGVPGLARAELVFLDADGRQLTRAELLDRLGGPLDPRMDPSLAGRLRGGVYDDLWSRRCADDGAIALTDEAGTWTTFVQRPVALVGLRYQLRGYAVGPDGVERLLGDVDLDGHLTEAEREADGVNDPWDDTLEADSGVSFRGSLLEGSSRHRFRFDFAPRETDHARWIIAQLHVGSFLARGEASNRSTFQDLQAHLGYFKELGVTTLELLPTNEVEGTRDWGYLGASSLATEASLGFEDETGRWVDGTEALQRFIDAAHHAGLNVLGDVVYNHLGGSQNFLWELDGPENPWFNWTPGTVPATLRDTPWGAMPAYLTPEVHRFFVDHAVYQVCELHHDGLRFDFTEPIKGTGGVHGWHLLREINRALHFLRPRCFTAAEQFDYDPAMTLPAGDRGQGGGGFDAQWYTEFQHRLVRDNDRPGLLQQVAAGQRTDIDAFVGMLLQPRGLSSWTAAVTVLSNHDEVGNADRTINVARGGVAEGLPSQRARALARFAAGMAFTAPGIPMFFQGEESLASNRFRWGVPSTWDLGWSWRELGPGWDWPALGLDEGRVALYRHLWALTPEARLVDPGYLGLPPAEAAVCDALAGLPEAGREQALVDLARRLHFEFFKDAIRLRREHRAFDADAELRRLYTHNDDAVLAFHRRNGLSEAVVAGSLNRDNLTGYWLPLPPGQWKEIFNSDAVRYGGGNFGNAGATFAGGGEVGLNLPAGGYVVLERVG